jgi:hypothetical protein
VALVRLGLTNADAIEQRALSALSGYVGGQAMLLLNLRDALSLARAAGLTGQSVGRVSPQGVTRRGRASNIHDLPEQPEADAPVALVGVALDGGGFLVDADDGADVLLQVLVGERDGVAGPEVVAAGRGGAGGGVSSGRRGRPSITRAA